MITPIRRKILIPITMAPKYRHWLQEEHFDFELICGTLSAGVGAFTNTGETTLKHITENGGDNYVVLFHMPSKRIDQMDGVDIADAIEHKLKLNIPVIIISTLIEEKLYEALKGEGKTISKNVFFVGNQIIDKQEFITLIKKATAYTGYQAV